MINRSIGILSRFHPAKLLLLCYLVYAFVGWFILLTPICQMNAIPSVDCFFTAIAAMTTTGLNTVDVGTAFSFLGQIVILLLIQAGGIGYMTFNSFIILATTNRLSRFTKKITTAEFPMPKDFIISEFIAHVVIFTFVCEAIGAIALSWIFKNSGVDNYIWNGIFHSISAFCTAGFSLFQTALPASSPMRGQYRYLTLSIIGAIGFITWLNFYKKVIGERNFSTFTAKVILLVTFWFLVIGTLVFFFTEHSFRGGFTAQNLWTSFFQVMTASTTAGFNTIDLGSLKYTSIVLLLALMVIGASPSGTGGGLKTTTFVALVGLVKSTLKGESVVNFWKREIPLKTPACNCNIYLLCLCSNNRCIFSLVYGRQAFPTNLI